jgi:hypothetical protein
MDRQIVLISDEPADTGLAQEVAQIAGYRVNKALGIEEVRRTLSVSNPETIVFWDGEKNARFDLLREIVPKYIPYNRIFVITNDPITEYPHLLRTPIFSHHLKRKFKPPAPSLYSKIMLSTLSKGGLTKYFPDTLVVDRLVIRKSGHRHAAIEALQKHLQKKGIRGRLAAGVAKAAGELLLNAIFEAPALHETTKDRKNMSRDAEFDLRGRSEVVIEICADKEYMWILVKDYFGSLQRGMIFEALLGTALNPIDKDKVKLNRPDLKPRLGVKSTIESGLSLLFDVTENERTDAHLFFPIVKDYREFRNSFQFLSLFPR